MFRMDRLDGSSIRSRTATGSPSTKVMQIFSLSKKDATAKGEQIDRGHDARLRRLYAILWLSFGFRRRC